MMPYSCTYMATVGIKGLNWPCYLLAGRDVNQCVAGQSRSPVQAATGTQVSTRQPSSVYQWAQLRWHSVVSGDTVNWWLSWYHVYIGRVGNIGHQQEHSDAGAEVLQRLSECLRGTEQDNTGENRWHETIQVSEDN